MANTVHVRPGDTLVLHLDGNRAWTETEIRAAEVRCAKAFHGVRVQAVVGEKGTAVNVNDLPPDDCGIRPVKLDRGGTLLWVRRDQFGVATEVWPIPKALVTRVGPAPAYPLGSWAVRPNPPAPAFMVDAREVIDIGGLTEKEWRAAMHATTPLLPAEYVASPLAACSRLIEAAETGAGQLLPELESLFLNEEHATSWEWVESGKPAPEADPPAKPQTWRDRAPLL